MNVPCVQTSDGREKALSARLVQLNGMQYAISRVDPVKTSVVRLSNVGLDPNDGQIGATCELFGRVEKVLPRSDGSVDVFFRPSEMENIPRILSRSDFQQILDMGLFCMIPFWIIFFSF